MEFYFTHNRMTFHFFQETYLVATDTHVPLDLGTLPGKTGLEESHDTSSRSRRASSSNKPTGSGSTKPSSSSSSGYHDQLVWQWEIESRLIRAEPFFAVVIYDSCRDSATPQVDEELQAARVDAQKESVTINMVIGYGTRSKMRSYEYSTSRMSQGVYLKHLLRHLGDTALSVTEMFARVAESVDREEELSLSMRMKPEFR